MGSYSKGINITKMNLVPKVTIPSYVKEYRLIACCSTLYKLISKILTAKLKKVVDYIVSPSQSAFIEGRNLLDNMMNAHELVKGYAKKGISPRYTIKVEFIRPIIEWPFLRMVLLEFRIPTKLVELMIECLMTVQYTLLINGGLTPIFAAKKGLRQGDPMSPYLFVLAMEYLHHTLQQLRHNPLFHHHPRCKKLIIIHICFADNLLMSSRADETSVKLMFHSF